MKQRHRTPTIFSIYMVDVLCCALGCVILLWLINFREAKQRAWAASETGQQLADTRGALETSQSELATLRHGLTQAQAREKEIQAQLRVARAAHDLSEKMLLTARKEQSQTKEDLRLSIQQLAALRLEIKEAEDRSALKTAELAALLKKLTAVEVESRDYKSKLSLAQIRARLLEDDVEKSKRELTAADKLRRDVISNHDLLSQRLLLSAKELQEAHALIVALKKEKISLADQARLIKRAAERRFAGITLTGKNVLFLVDMSGSMDLIDENTPDPDKWPLVCATVAQIMESMTDLRKYQVILFSDRVRYALGNDGFWLSYNPVTTPKAVFRTLKTIKPQGETNMAAVFNEAFRFRDDGLDTIYVLSDGLPNAGPGLPFTSQSLTETQKTEILSKYVRNRLRYVLNHDLAGRPRVRINTIGFFFESPDVGAFLWALARENNGSFVGMSK